MSFVKRELIRIQQELTRTRGQDVHGKLYIAQQALDWALDPTAYKSPYDMIMGIHQEKEDCSVEPRPPLS